MFIRVITAKDKLIEYGLFSMADNTISLSTGVSEGVIVCGNRSIGNGSY